MDHQVIKAMMPYWSEQFYNPSALYLDAKVVAANVAEARGRIAGWLGAKPGEIIFTAGGTEANNLAVHGIMRSFPGKHMLISPIEHESMLRPAQNYDCQELTVDTEGFVDPQDVKKNIRDDTVLISVMYANNEIGTIEPVSKIAIIVKEILSRRQKEGNELPLFLHADACQAAAYLDIHTSRLGVDLMTINAGKIYGPKQCGALYLRSGVLLKAQLMGGGQEQGIRSGTENVPAIIGFAAALDLVQGRRHEEVNRMQGLQRVFFDLLSQKIPHVIKNGPDTRRLPNNIHITLPGQDNERLVMLLDEAGIACAAGSACSASSEESSHVLRAIGLSDTEARSSLRFTMGAQTQEQDIRYSVDVLVKAIS